MVIAKKILIHLLILIIWYSLYSFIFIMINENLNFIDDFLWIYNIFSSWLIWNFINIIIWIDSDLLILIFNLFLNILIISFYIYIVKSNSKHYYITIIWMLINLLFWYNFYYWIMWI